MSLGFFPLIELQFDVVFTDYIGLFGLRDSRHFPLYKCRIRVLDSFGTEPICTSCNVYLYSVPNFSFQYFDFNFTTADQFRTLNFQIDETMGMFNNWNFESSQQFWTLFPHSPDNSFLGFVVDTPNTTSATTKENQAVIYGKEAWYRYGKEELLDTIGAIIELHSTFKVR